MIDNLNKDYFFIFFKMSINNLKSNELNLKIKKRKSNSNKKNKQYNNFSPASFSFQTDESILSTISNNYSYAMIKESLINFNHLSNYETLIQSKKNSLLTIKNPQRKNKNISIPKLKRYELKEITTLFNNYQKHKKKIKSNKLSSSSSFITNINQPIKIKESFSNINNRLKLNINQTLNKYGSSIIKNDSCQINKIISNRYEKDKEKEKNVILYSLLNKRKNTYKLPKFKTKINLKKLKQTKCGSIISKISFPYIITDNSIMNKYYLDNEKYMKNMLNKYYIKNKFINKE